MSSMSLKEECENKKKAAERDRQRREEREKERREREEKERDRREKMARERERERDRDRRPSNRTDSDDPKLLKSRVFIGNLPHNKCTRDELSDKFSKYGKILGISMFTGFGFVQFDREGDAKRCVEMENGGLFKGSKLDIKMAADGRKDKNQRDRDRRSPPPRRDRRSLSSDRGRRSSRDRSPHSDKGSRDHPPRDPYPDDPYRRVPYPPRDPYYDRMIDDPYRRDPYLDPYRGPYAPPPPLRAPPRVDCAILLLSRTIREYGESVQLKLKGISIMAEIVVLIDEAALPAAMEDAKRRKLPFTVVLNSQNEVHRSATVSILHGQPQEHRNMPLDDAVNLLSRSFETFQREQKEKAASKLPVYEHLPAEAQIQYLLNLLADDHHLTVEELDKVIAFLQDRRRRLAASQGVSETKEDSIDKQQEELQAKILSILGSDAKTPTPVGAPIKTSPLAPPRPVPAPQPEPKPVPAPVGAPGSLNLDSPSVQQALDNLISSGPNLLQRINSAVQQSGQPRPVQAPQPQGHQAQQGFAGAGLGHQGFGRPMGQTQPSFNGGQGGFNAGLGQPGVNHEQDQRFNHMQGQGFRQQMTPGGPAGFGNRPPFGY